MNNPIVHLSMSARSGPGGLLIVRRANGESKIYYLAQGCNKNQPNRAARLVSFFLAWLARQPGAQLPRRERGPAQVEA